MFTQLTVLIVEDDALTAESLKYNVEDCGFTVLAIAYTFEEALVAIDQYRPDLTLLDINLNNYTLPANNGLVLAQRLMACHLPFIFLTAYSDRDTILQAARLRPSGYLIKPVNPASLFAAIQTAIENESTKWGPATESDQLDQRSDFFFVKVGNRNVKILWNSVYCLEAGKNYVQIRIIDSPVTHTVRGTLNVVMQQLVPSAIQSQFLQFNRGMFVNINHITRFDAEAVYCRHLRIDNTRLPLKELKTLLLNSPTVQQTGQ